jgi:hypothetical protein
MGYDFVSSNMARSAAQKELDNQKRINQQMLAIQKEQMELEKKTKEVQARIDAIKQLRESQQGPSACCRRSKRGLTRFRSLPDSDRKQRRRESRSRVSRRIVFVTKFGQSLEFSGACSAT